MIFNSIVTVIFLVLTTGPAHALDFSRYHTQTEINSYLAQMARDHSELVQFKQLGVSEQGREISYIIVSNAPANAPAIYFNGTHHGNEKSSTEAVLGLADHLLANAANVEIAELLAQYRIFLQPLVNADGHAANTREDPRGRDPNRDYSYPNRSDADSFRVPVIQLVRKLVDETGFRAAVAFHSGMEGVLWPWCYSGQKPADNDVLHTISKMTAAAMGMSYYVQSYFDYATNGEFTDYAYMKQGTLAVTVEVSNAATPASSQLAGVVSRSVRGSVAFIKAIKSLDDGILIAEKAPEIRFLGFLNADAVRRGSRLE